jgi:hypothetical protein
MVSESSALLASGIFADPYLWAAAGAAFVGLAAGQALRGFVSVREGSLRHRRRRPLRVARAIALLSLGILCLAALLVLADRASLAEGLARGLIVPWAALTGLMAFVAGFMPIAVGLPIAGLCLAILGFASLSLEGWLPYRSSSGSPVEAARILPYEVGPASFRGQIEMTERDSVPIVQEMSVAAPSVGLCVEGLSLDGPLGFIADLVHPRRPIIGAAAARGVPTVSKPAKLRLYRIVGLVSPGGASWFFPNPPHLDFLEALLPLPADSGLAPAAPLAERSVLFGLATRTRAASPAVSLLALEPVVFGLRDDASVFIIR